VATSEDLVKLSGAKQLLNTLSLHYNQAEKSISAQVKIMSNTAEQLVAGYSIYGLENNITENFAEANVNGLTEPNTSLSEPNTQKLIKQPSAGDTLDDRLTFFGHKPPAIKSEVLSKSGSLSDTGVGSILPWTPHPQHSYKDNSTRVINRTGNSRPTTPSEG